MTEKRFKVNADYLNNLDSIIDNETGIEHDYLEIEELLNGLNDENKQLKHDATVLICSNQDYRKENEQLKSDNFNLTKTVECLDKTVKEQCNKIAWADECGVRWEEEYEKWKG